MDNPVDYSFYTSIYLGNSIPKTDFPRLALRAAAKLEQYQRAYRVEGSQRQLDMAVCAMADTLYYYEGVENGAVAASISVGSVSSSSGVQVDASPKAQSAALYNCARQHLSIYRGRGGR